MKCALVADLEDITRRYKGMQRQFGKMRNTNLMWSLKKQLIFDKYKCQNPGNINDKVILAKMDRMTTS